MRKFVIGLLFVLTHFGLIVTASANDGFPGRDKYPHTKVYELADLKRDLDKVIVVDARSTYEYETLRIKGAHSVPINSPDFADRLNTIRKDEATPIVFYCNGRTCMKSYKAAIKAGEYGVENVYAYDAGIFEWASTYPENAQLLGVSPVNRNDLITKKEFKKHLLAPEAFADMVYAPGAKVLVLDVRDSNQRGSSIGFFPGKERWVDLKNKDKLTKHIEKAKDKGKTLMIYDEVGKQVRWLQYTIESVGHADYYFMEGGSNKYYAEISKGQ